MMQIVTRIVAVIISMTAFCLAPRASEVFDGGLSVPPAMTAEQIALANEEQLPENLNRLKIAYASDYYQVSDKETDDELSPLVEVTLSTRRGRKTVQSYEGVNAYAEFPLGTNGYSLWLTGYKDPSFKGVYLGLAKKQGNWQFGIGTGKVNYDKLVHTVINPWIYYVSDEWEAYVHAEHYTKDSENPLWYKGYIEKRLNDFGIGFYGEKNMGVGPRISFKLNNYMKAWATVPVLYQPETGKVKFFLNFIFTF